MENRMVELKSQVERVNELIHSEYDRLMEKVVAVIEKFITNPHEASICRKQLRFGLRDEFEINFEVGFYNPEESRIDFGSDVWFEYNSKDRTLRVNYGTIGYYDKTAIYQIRRVNMISEVFAHIEDIEAAFQAIAEEAAGNYRSYHDEKYHYEAEIQSLENQQKAEALKTLEYSLKEGDILKYDETKVRYGSQLFKTRAGGWIIQKICNKTIKLKDPFWNEIRQFPKEQIISLIYNKSIMVNPEEEN